jgi:N-acetylglucosamine-6-phosphate deacetylase
VTGGALDGHLVLPDRVLPGRLRFGERIEAAEPRPGVPDRFILPGFIDTHVHGGGGGDTIDGPQGIDTLARFHLRHGTTTLLPTTITRPWPEVMAMLRGVAEVMQRGIPDGPNIPGAHLEGPFLNPNRLGAQPPFAVPPAPGLVSEAIEMGVVRVVTVAPELEGALSAIERFAAAGVRVSLGHTTGTSDDADAAMARAAEAGGTVAGTHLFNAMTGIAGRAPGVAGAVLRSRTAFAELILDGHHVHRASFELAHAALGDRLLLITDAMRAAGLGDCVSELGGRPVTVRGGIARLDDGALAGSVLTMDGALRNALAAGIALPVAAQLVSGNAARYLGLHDRGAIEAGRRADLVVLDAGMQVAEVWVGGRRVA